MHQLNNSYEIHENWCFNGTTFVCILQTLTSSIWQRDGCKLHLPTCTMNRPSFKSRTRTMADIQCGEIDKNKKLILLVFFLDLHVQKLCQHNSSLVLPHPHECQLYYDCSTKYNTLPPNFVQHMRECPFPDLFSLQTLSCEDYKNVKCDERVEYTTACKY